MPDNNLKFKNKNKNNYIAAGIGICTGLINGFFGSGGGMLAVPALNGFLKLEEHEAHASAIMLTLPATIVSSVYYFLNSDININIALKVSAAGIAGSLTGAHLLCRLSTPILRIIFGLVMAAGGIFMVFNR